MSFHPLSVKGDRYRNLHLSPNAGSILGIILTSGSYGWIDDPDDKTAFRNAGIWYLPGTRSEITNDVCKQIKLFKISYASMKKNIQGQPDPGPYELYNRNCGTWVKTMVERANLNYPFAATVTYNAGATYGGPADWIRIPGLITYYARKINWAAQAGSQ